ncbi:MAG: twin-arginine translocation signal domain-containing protein [Anaerolineae bacterium]|nr:twin-arginine translocation signal domain-containing protein [Anaerolineae bacterium]MCX8068684.1 twin-arginine translocation signal domain-containing protein [Anaerolineae bacterium]MDW7991438.1 twin-arginine translocation signal domain-containing protein [Anaerolineae bacterium]
MNRQEVELGRLRRSARIARITERLQRLDDGTLEVLDRITAEALVGGEPTQPAKMNRRQFLGAAAAGGAVVALTGGLVVWQLSSVHTALLEKEVTALRELLALYEEMDNLGLDDRLREGIRAVGGILETAGAIAERLLEAIRSARTALLKFQSKFPDLHAAIRWLRESLLSLSQKLTALENEVNDFLELTNPIAETVGGFLARVLDRLPGALGRQVRGGLERMGEIIAALPTFLQGLFTRILEPLEDWFNSRADAGLNSWLVNPLLHNVLDPAEALVERVLELTTTWKEQLAGPSEEALNRRSELRAEILRRKQMMEG